MNYSEHNVFLLRASDRIAQGGLARVIYIEEARRAIDRAWAAATSGWAMLRLLHALQPAPADRDAWFEWDMHCGAPEKMWFDEVDSSTRIAGWVTTRPSILGGGIVNIGQRDFGPRDQDAAPTVRATVPWLRWNDVLNFYTRSAA